MPLKILACASRCCEPPTCDRAGEAAEPGQARFLTPRVEDFIADTEANVATRLGWALRRTACEPFLWNTCAKWWLMPARDKCPCTCTSQNKARMWKLAWPNTKFVPSNCSIRMACLIPRFTAVHAIHVTGEEISRLSQAGATVCACPTTERNLGDGTVPADQFLNAGLRVSLGSDSNVQINLLEDARSLEYHLRILKLERALLSPKQLFGCATESGASSLGARSGSLEIGRPADFFTVALDDPSIAGADADSLLSHIVFSAERSAVRDVAVGGKFAIREGRHKLQQEIISDFTRLQREMWT